MRTRKFCWLPTRVYIVKYWQQGFKWLDHVWIGTDGVAYTTEQELKVDIAELYGRIKNYDFNH